MEKRDIKKSSLAISENGLSKRTPSEEKKTSSKRLEVLKTYKIYIGGQFPSNRIRKILHSKKCGR